MSSHFNLKSLTFYGVAISLVLILFNVVTIYGETQLQAPVPIDGRYRLSYTQNLPNCLKSDALVLDIEQSGIYLNGSLLPARTDTQRVRAGEKQASLSGQFSNQQLSLAGTVPSLTLCNKPVSQPETSARPQENSPISVRIQSRVEGKNLEGKMALSGIPEAIGFTAQRETPVQPSENSSSH
jgi:hypothetical protein